jgi:chemotaxis protein methyltransferase CheR
MQTLSLKEFEKFARLVYDKAGINLKEEKHGLVQSRVGKLLRLKNIATFNDYYKILIEDRDGSELVDFLDAISTNVTHFFRENSHFDYLSRVFMRHKLQLANSGKEERVIRCWSAGCSKGHEPYSMAITISEALRQVNASIPVKILATDLSTKVLKEAIEGVYDQSQLNSVSKELRTRYFRPVQGGQSFAVTDELRNMITFRQFNLMHHFPFRHKFDFIFCRNVMIYFDPPTQAGLVRKFHDVIKPGGLFFVGHCETLNRLNTPFKFIEASVYTKP